MDTVTQFDRLSEITVALVASLLTLLLPSSLSLAQPSSEPLLITEFFYDTPGVDAQEEWVEIANVGNAPSHLGGFGLGDEEQIGGREGMVRFPPDTVLQPGQVVLIAQVADAFRTQYGFNPDFEFQNSDAGVPDMVPDVGRARGEIALNNDGDELILLDDGNRLLDAVSYGDSQAYLSPSIPAVLSGQSLERVPAHCDTDTARDWQPRDTPAPGVIDVTGDCRAPRQEDGSSGLLSIGAIQGLGLRSPFINENVTFEGVVIGLQEDRNARGAVFYTLFVQDLPGRDDGDPATSDGIAVFHGVRRPPYMRGDVVRVKGQVTEFYGLTEIDDSGLQIDFLAENGMLPAPVELEPSTMGSSADYEPFESMRVSLPESIVVGPTFSGCGLTVVEGTTFRRVIRQKLSDQGNAVIPVLHHSDVNCGDFPQVKVGDVVSGLQGPLTYHFDQFKIVNQDSGDLLIVSAPLPDEPSPPHVDSNQFIIATFNVHDFFNAERDTGRQEEPLVSVEEEQVKTTKLARTISETLSCPTLLAVQEVENRGLLEGLAQQLEPRCGFRYAFVHHESPDVRGIDLALMYYPGRIQEVESTLRQFCSHIATEVLDSSIDCPTDQDPLFSRPPLQVDLLLDGFPYTIIVTHFKSKREGERETEPRRLAQARVVAALVERYLEQDRRTRVVVLGDFNDYELSETMATLTTGASGLKNVTAQVPLQQRFTYNFSGVSQLLDAILVSPALVPEVSFSTIAHVNADFPVAWAADSDLVFRSSDHDIPVVILESPQVLDATPDSRPPSSEASPGQAGSTPDEGRPTPSGEIDASAQRSPWLLGIAAVAVVVSAILIAAIYLRR